MNKLTPRKIELSELVSRLGDYEHRYGFSTIEFFQRFTAGELGDSDDFMLWAGLYHLYLTSHPIRQFMYSENVITT